MAIEISADQDRRGDDDEEREADVAGIELEGLLEMPQRRLAAAVKAAISEKPSG